MDSTHNKPATLAVWLRGEAKWFNDRAECSDEQVNYLDHVAELISIASELDEMAAPQEPTGPHER